MPVELTEKPIHSKTENTTLSTGKPYQVSIIRSITQFEKLHAAWTQFMQDSDIYNLCMSYGWLHTWLKYFPPEQLLIIIIKDQQQNWVGIAPLMINRSRNGLAHRMLRHVQFIGTNPNVFDWMKIAILPTADSQAVMTAVGGVLQQERWDVLDLQFCLEHSQIEALCHHLNIAEPKQAIQETTPIPYLLLPPTEADYEKVRRKKTRLEVNRHCNRFVKEFGSPLQLEFQPSCEASHAILTRFFAGHIKYWGEKGQKSDFQRFPHLYDFYKDMLEYSDKRATENEPKLLFSVLKMEEYQLSYHLGFWQGNSYLSHITHFNQGFRSYSPGTVHMDKLVFDTIRRGGIEFEFGRGDEPYKKMWTQDKKSLWNLRSFRNPISAAIWQIDIVLKKILGKAST